MFLIPRRGGNQDQLRVSWSTAFRKLDGSQTLYDFRCRHGAFSQCHRCLNAYSGSSVRLVAGQKSKLVCTTWLARCTVITHAIFLGAVGHFMGQKGHRPEAACRKHASHDVPSDRLTAVVSRSGCRPDRVHARLRVDLNARKNPRGRLQDADTRWPGR